MNASKTCAITGHRFASLPFGTNEESEQCQLLRAALRREFIQLIEAEHVETFLCGMALGSDQIASEILIHLKNQYPHLKLHAYIPCHEQYLKWNEAQTARYRTILRHAEEIRTIGKAYTRGCMQKRNQAMVDDADLLLAVYVPNTRGGTAQTIRYARKLGREIRLIDPSKV